MNYALERATDVRNDLAEMFEFLVESYQAFGEDYDSAVGAGGHRAGLAHRHKGSGS